MLRALLTIAREAWHRRQRDPAWKPSAVIRTFDGHDQAKAEAVFEREQRQAAQRRAKNLRTVEQTRRGKKADVYVLPKPRAGKHA